MDMDTEQQIAEWIAKTNEAYLKGTLTPEQLAHLKATGFPFPKR